MKRTATVPLETIANTGYWHTGLVDSHFHSSALLRQGVDPSDLLRHLYEYGMGAIVDVAIQPEDTETNYDLACRFPEIYRTCGLHPSFSNREDWRDALDLAEREVKTGLYAAVGEMGLDWYRRYAPPDRQLEVFEAQIDMARRLGYPVIVHNRDADQDCLRLIRSHKPDHGGIMHCYSSAPGMVRSFVDAGMYISFAGNLTFPSAGYLREALLQVPPERLLLETDAPFLAPHPYRGRTNHPGMVAYTYAVAADTLHQPVEDVIALVARNLKQLLGPPRTTPVRTSPVTE